MHIERLSGLNELFLPSLKKIAAILFIFIMSIQLWPVDLIGKSLANNTFTEEEVHKAKVPHGDLIFDSFEFDITQNAETNSILIHEPSYRAPILSAPLLEILSPPPNC